jgi:hypothetical protein
MHYEVGSPYGNSLLTRGPTGLENFYYMFQRVLEQDQSVLDTYKKIAGDEELIKAIAHPMMFVNDPEFIVWAVENREEFLAQQSIINTDDTGFTLNQDVFGDKQQLHHLLAEVNWIGNHSPSKMQLLLNHDVFLSEMKENCPSNGFHLLKVLDVMNCALDLLDDKQLSNPKDVVSFVLALQEKEAGLDLLDKDTWVAHLYGSDYMFHVGAYQRIYKNSGVPEEKILCDAKWSETGSETKKKVTNEFADIIRNLPEALLDDETQTLALIFSVHGSAKRLAGNSPAGVADSLLGAEEKTKGIVGRMKIITHSCGGYDFMNAVVDILEEKQISTPQVVYTTAENDNYGVGQVQLPKELTAAVSSDSPADYKSWNESAQKNLEYLNNNNTGFREKFSENFFASEEQGYLNRAYFNNPTWRMSVTDDVRDLAKRHISNKKILRKLKVGKMIYFSDTNTRDKADNLERSA